MAQAVRGQLRVASLDLAAALPQPGCRRLSGLPQRKAAAAAVPASLRAKGAPSALARPWRRLRVAAGAAAEATPAPSQGGEAGEKAPKPSVAEFARTMMELGEEGSLCTVRSEGGTPLGTYVAYVLDAIGRPILALPQHSLGLEDLQASSRCSLHVQVELPGLQKPQITICGHASPPEDAATAMKFELAWSRKFEDGAPSGGVDSAPALWQLSVEKLLVAADVDQVPEWIHADEYLEADTDPLKDVARKIVEDVNREHWQDLPRFCHAFAGVEDEVEDASIIWVDRLGFDLRVWLRSTAEDVPSVREIRIPFSREAADEREARSSITMMAQVAWEKERNYTPQMPSFASRPSEDK